MSNVPILLYGAIISESDKVNRHACGLQHQRPTRPVILKDLPRVNIWCGILKFDILGLFENMTMGLCT
jgi:hypothetical protein